MINGVAWSPNGKLLATACDDMQLRLFDVAALSNQNPKFKAVKTPQAALGVGFGNDGSSLVAAVRGERGAEAVQVWWCRVHSGKASRTLHLNQGFCNTEILCNVCDLLRACSVKHVMLCSMSM